MYHLTQLIRDSYKRQHTTIVHFPDGTTKTENGPDVFDSMFSLMFRDKYLNGVLDPEEMQLLLTKLKDDGNGLPATTEYMILLQEMRADKRTNEICDALAKLSPDYKTPTD